VLQPVSVGHKSLADYTHLAGRPLIQEIRDLAEDLNGLRVLHLSATAFGGGVSEILYTLIPLMKDVGIEAEWQVMLGREEFYNVTKRLHNALQGNPDPLSPKNMALSPEDAAFVCDQFGIDVDRPLICQVSRFDPWKDPMGVIDAYRKLTQEMPEVQLALVGSMATDDPEGWEFFNSTMAYADGDPDIHILNNLNNVGAIEVNAFQSQADVVIQKSTREGFGLTVSEALWKARPFIGGKVGGIPLQVQDGETGYLVSSPDECADRSLRILQEPDLGKRLGRSGKEHVRKHFLTPRLLRDWLRIFRDHR
jgi:glycosyltransferase involved in cell wall biosynthesis